MNDYALKQSAYEGNQVDTAYHGSLAQANAPIKLTAIEDACSQVELMRQQVNLISGDVAAFLDRAAGGALNSNSAEKCANTPSPSGQLPRLGENLKELKHLINTLGERVSKLNQIA